MWIPDSRNLYRAALATAKVLAIGAAHSEALTLCKPDAAVSSHKDAITFWLAPRSSRSPSSLRPRRRRLR